ncbi:MAG: nickel pincer cofactor biosynthesis protein LarB [Chitinispirillaceae bacterium]|nr:nickel pincer cofactor biosynthesis protein LarB [Chitinispirillaceae bacterium]
MDNKRLTEILETLSRGSMSIDEALGQLRDLPFSDLGFAMVDHHRVVRKGYPEVIFCQGKTEEQVVEIAKTQIDHEETVFGTRANEAVLQAVADSIDGVAIDRLGLCFWKKSAHWRPRDKVIGTIVVCTAGTADLRVSLEAQRTLEILGHPCKALSDVGVAGIHRLFAHREVLEKAAAVIAVAGMEGALPSVIAGYVSCPVIAVPTSVGYGSHLGGMVPLFAMLNSCSTGLSVVNIDNGFGAACAAAAINDLGGRCISCNGKVPD